MKTETLEQLFKNITLKKINVSYDLPALAISSEWTAQADDYELTYKCTEYKTYNAKTKEFDVYDGIADTRIFNTSAETREFDYEADASDMLDDFLNGAYARMTVEKEEEILNEYHPATRSTEELTTELEDSYQFDCEEDNEIELEDDDELPLGDDDDLDNCAYVFYRSEFSHEFKGKESTLSIKGVATIANKDFCALDSINYASCRVDVSRVTLEVENEERDITQEAKNQGDTPLGRLYTTACEEAYDRTIAGLKKTIQELKK